jgi:hypothetical protein
MTPSQRCELTFEAARKLAEENSFALAKEKPGVYSLTDLNSENYWYVFTGTPCILIRREGEPKLNLPEHWTLLDVVVAAIEAKDKKYAKGGGNER